MKISHDPTILDGDKNGNIICVISTHPSQFLPRLEQTSVEHIIKYYDYTSCKRVAQTQGKCIWWNHTEEWLNDERNQIRRQPESIAANEQGLFVLALDKTIWLYSNNSWEQIPELPRQRRPF